MGSRGKNLVILIGHLGNDPEMRYFQDGTATCNFSVATSESWNDRQTGEKKEKTEWHRIAVFRKLAEICGQYLTKGSKVYIEGKLATRSWEKDGITRYTTEIVANEMQMLDSSGGEGGQGNAPQHGTAGGGYGQPQSQPAGGGYGQPAQRGQQGGYGAPQQPGAGGQPGGGFQQPQQYQSNYSQQPPDDDVPF